MAFRTQSDIGLPDAVHPSTWRLEATPACVVISRRTILSTSLGRLLEKHGVMTDMIFVHSLFGVSLYMSLLFVGEHATSKFSSPDTSEATHHTTIKWDVARSVISIINLLWLEFLILHRVNLQLFKISIASFDCMMIMGHYIIWVVCRYMVEIVVFADHIDGMWVCSYIVLHTVFAITLLLFIGCIDALRIRTFRKVLILGSGAGGIAFYWIFVGFFSKAWPSHGLCALDASCNDLKRRHLSSCFTVGLFIAKGMALKVVHKHSFVVFKPLFEGVQVIETKPDEERQTAPQPTIEGMSEQGSMEERLERTERKVQSLTVELMTVRAQLKQAEQQYHRPHEHVELCEQSCQVSPSDAALSTGEQVQIAAADNSTSVFASAQTLESLPLIDDRFRFERASRAQKVETLTEEIMTVRAQLQAATQHLQARHKRVEFRDQSCQVSSLWAPLSTGQQVRLEAAVTSSSALEGVQAPDALRCSEERPSCDCAAEIRRLVLCSKTYL